jgi:hypothetical protein
VVTILRDLITTPLVQLDQTLALVPLIQVVITPALIQLLITTPLVRLGQILVQVHHILLGIMMDIITIQLIQFLL